jgi:hypothetical protein
MPTSPPRPCSRCGQPVVRGGYCARRYSQADRQRETSKQRGGRDLRRQPGQVRQLPQHPHPGVRHDAMTVRGHFHPGKPLRYRC